MSESAATVLEIPIPSSAAAAKSSATATVVDLPAPTPPKPAAKPAPSAPPAKKPQAAAIARYPPAAVARVVVAPASKPSASKTAPAAASVSKTSPAATTSSVSKTALVATGSLLLRALRAFGRALRWAWRSKGGRWLRDKPVRWLGAAAGLALAAFVVMAGIGHMPRPGRSLYAPVPVFVTVETNIPVKVFARHLKEEQVSETFTELGEAPLVHAQGAHVRDTIVLQNRIQGAYYEHELPFGEPNSTVKITKTFGTGRVRFKLPPKLGQELYVYLNDLQVAPYTAEVQIELTEGKHVLELRGAYLDDPISLTVFVRPNETTMVDPPPALLPPAARANKR